MLVEADVTSFDLELDFIIKWMFEMLDDHIKADFGRINSNIVIV